MINEFFESILVPEAKFSVADKIQFKRRLDMILQIRSQVEPQNIKKIVDYILANGFSERGFKACCLSGFLYLLTDRQEYLVNAVDMLTEMELNVEELIDVFTVARSLRFVLSNKQELHSLFPRKLCMQWYADGVSRLKSHMNERGVKIKDEFEPNDRVVILTTMLLGPKHAPSGIAYEYASAFQRHGKQVLIVNTLEMTGYQPGPLYGNFHPNFLPEFAGVKRINYEGSTLNTYQSEIGHSSLSAFEQTVVAIEAFNPSIVCTVGSYSFISELFNERAFVFMSPTTNELPYVIQNKFYAQHRILDYTKEDLRRENLVENFMFQKHKKFPIPGKVKDYFRADFDIPEDAFVCVSVGNRLDTAMTSDFLEVLDRVAEVENIYFMFVGQLDVNNKLGDYQALLKKSRHVNHIPDLVNFYNICDLYVNPVSSGGGTTAYFANNAGVPVVGLPYGDGQNQTSFLDRVETLADLEKLILDISRSPELMEEGRVSAKSILSEYISYDEFVDEIDKFYRSYKRLDA